MYERILVPVDGSEMSAAALDHGVALAERLGADVHVLFVADTARDSVTVVGTDLVDALEREGESVVEEATDRYDGRGVTFVTAVLQGDPAETIVDYADDRDVGAIVVGTHGRAGLRRTLLGSVTDRVVRTATVPVVTVGPETEPPG
jgi:nucleotide-binding universal stress UspA family protein